MGEPPQTNSIAPLKKAWYTPMVEVTEHPVLYCLYVFLAVRALHCYSVAAALLTVASRNRFQPLSDTRGKTRLKTLDKWKEVGS